MNKRYFFVSAISSLTNNQIFADSFDYKDTTYPNHNKLIEIVKKIRKNVREVTITGITEMSEADYKTFRGE